MPISTIAEVITRLNEIVAETENSGSAKGYFAVLYCRMTEAVQQGILQNNFADNTQMEKLDVIFASRYLEAYDAYKNNQPTTKSWQATFNACEQKSFIILQHLFLGVNTHINLDLAIAAADTCQGASILSMQDDYNKINDIIASLTNEVQTKLTKVWWPLRFIKNIVNNKQDAVINFSIAKARDAAWISGVALANLQGSERTNYINILDETVLSIATAIQHPGFFINILLKFIRWFEHKNVKENIELIK